MKVAGIEESQNISIAKILQKNRKKYLIKIRESVQNFRLLGERDIGANGLL
jgi:hypothetical protein